MGTCNQLAETFQHGRFHADIGQIKNAARLVEQAHHRRLAVLHRQRGKAHVDAFITHLHLKASVLREPLLGNIKASHQLDARQQCCTDAALGRGLQTQDSINTETNT